MAYSAPHYTEQCRNPEPHRAHEWGADEFHPNLDAWCPGLKDTAGRTLMGDAVKVWRHSWPEGENMPTLYGNREAKTAPIRTEGVWLTADEYEALVAVAGASVIYDRAVEEQDLTQDEIQGLADNWHEAARRYHHARANRDTCPQCNGNGWYSVAECCGRYRGDGDCCYEPIEAQAKCETCDGSGEVER